MDDREVRAGFSRTAAGGGASDQGDGRSDQAAGTVATAALLIAVVTGASRVTGFGREAVIAAVYGASAEVDAYLVASGLPNIIIALLSTAVVTAAVPVIAARVRGDDVASGEQLLRTLGVAITVVLGAASLGMAAAAETVVGLMAPGFGPGQRELAAGLTRILLLSTVLVAGMNLISGFLQVHRRFFWPAFVGIPFNLAVVVAALVFGARFGVAALAWGFVAGSLLRVLVQLPPLRAVGFRWRGPVRWRDAGLRAVAGLLPVVLLGHVTSNVNAFVDRIVGSGLEAGAIAALNYGNRLVMLPHGLLVMALVQVLYPAFGSASGGRHRPAFADLATRGMTVLSCIVVPVATGLVVLAEPIVQVVYARGSFDSAATARTAVALAAYAPGLVALALRDLGTRALYGLQDARRPALIALTGMVVNVAGDLTLGPRFGVAGLAAATSISFTVAAALTVGLLAQRHHAVLLRPLGLGLLRNVVAVIPAAAAMTGVFSALGPVTSTPQGLVAVVAAGGVGLLVHPLSLWVLRAPELAELGTLIARLRTLVRRG